MRTEDMRAFVVLSRHLNFTKAAREFNTTQSTLSKCIARLEKELGFNLFERSRPLKLTARGTLFQGSAQSALSVLDSGIKLCRSRTDDSTALRVLLWFATRRMERFFAQEHDVPFTAIKAEAPDTLFSWVEAGNADAAIAYDVGVADELAQEARRRGVTWVGMGSSPMALVVSKGHPLYGMESLSMADLRFQHITVPVASAYNDTRLFIEALYGLVADFVIEYRPIAENTVRLLYGPLEGAAVFAPIETARNCKNVREDVSVFEDVEGKPFEFPMCLLYRDGDTNPVLAAFVERVRKFFDITEHA